MKLRLLFSVLCLFIYTNKTASEYYNPGCIRKNSDGILRDLIFMQIENGQVGLAITMLDIETADLQSVSGKNIEKALEEAQKKYNVDINPALQHLAKLKKQKAEQSPVPDLPD